MNILHFFSALRTSIDNLHAAAAGIEGIKNCPGHLISSLKDRVRILSLNRVFSELATDILYI